MSGVKFPFASLCHTECPDTLMGNKTLADINWNGFRDPCEENSLQSLDVKSR